MTTTTTTTAGVPQPPPPGELIFGKYQIIRRIAVGGMGEVFLARQSGVAGFDRLVILKSLLPDLAAQEDFVHQFLDEARVAARLNHPNIVSIYEVGQWGGTYFIGMEYIAGDNLSRLQRAAERAKRSVPFDVAALIVHDAAIALDHAHKAKDIQGRHLGIVHRDVSPQNIMVRTDGVTKVVDFGIAKAADRSSRTQTGLLKGKVQYMSPEQVAGVELDGRADQFALGVVLWEMCAGKKLFSGGNDVDVLRAVMQAPIPRLDDVNPSVPTSLARIVERMLQRERDRRYRSLAEAAAELTAFLDEHQRGTEAGSPEAQSSARERTAQFVADILGDEISAKTMDLTPSGANNFVISLQPQPPSTAATGQTNAPAGRGGVKLGVAAGVVVAVALAVVAAVVMLLPTSEPAAVAPLPLPGAQAAPTASVATEPTGAEVFFDGNSVGKAPVELKDITPDVEHKLEARLDKYEPAIAVLKLSPGSSADKFLRLVPRPARLKLTSEPSGATVKMDGKELGKTPFVVENLAPNTEKKLTLQLPKKPPRTVVAFLGPGEEAAQHVKLNEKPPPTKDKDKDKDKEPSKDEPSPPGPGFCTLNAKPWAKVFIAGKDMGSTPIYKKECPSGTYKVRFVNEGAGIDTTRNITVKPGVELKQTFDLAKP